MTDWPQLLKNFDWVITDPMRGVYMVGHNIWTQKNMILTPYIRAQ